MKIVDFKNLLQTHWSWQEGNLNNETKEIGGAVSHFSTIVSEFFNLTEPMVEKPEDFDLEKIEGEFKNHGRNTSFYLTEEKQKQGFVEYLIRKGYSFEGTDTWMVMDSGAYKHEKPKTEIVTVTEENFKDYDSVLSTTLSMFEVYHWWLRRILFCFCYNVCYMSLIEAILNHVFPRLTTLFN